MKIYKFHRNKNNFNNSNNHLISNKLIITLKNRNQIHLNYQLAIKGKNLDPQSLVLTYFKYKFTINFKYITFFKQLYLNP